MACPALALLFLAPPRTPGIELLRAVRNFYGPLQATLRQAESGPMLELQNGSIVHGREFAAVDRACEPLSYYARPSGIGIALEDMGKTGPLHVGVIGLGAGTLAAYARPGDTFRFYEINPQVRDMATDVFHYLACSSRVDVTLGDARLALEREKPNNFDLLAVDAFNSDAIPVHLLTREAFDLYWRHIRPGGLLAVHVSNTFVDLAPIVAAAAAQMGKAAGVIYTMPDYSKGISQSAWVLVTDDTGLFERPPFLQARPIDHSSTRVWTDDYSNLWRAMKW
jgi:spermidine synthase